MFEKNRIFDRSIVNHREVIDRLVVESSPRRIFLTMIIISSVICVLGLLNDSSAVVIGAMLVAPLLWPILGVSMGLIVGDWKMIKLSLISILLSTALAVVTAVIITLFYVPLGTTRELLLDTDFGFMLPVAVAAGTAAAFAICYENIKEAVSGVAISVALLPPLVSVGIGLGGMDWGLLERSAKLFLINLIGIITVTYIIFLLLGFHKFKRQVETAVKKEEKILQS